jgi:hypothetical protein
MADPEYFETFICTAIPAGIDGDELLLDVIVSPRLSSSDGRPADLSHWPDAQEWASISADWQVTFEQNGHVATVSGTEGVAGLSARAASSSAADAFSQMFPPGQTTTPYEPKDRQTAYIASYPVAAIRDAVKDLHVAVLQGARTSFPSVADLEQHDTFKALLKSLEPEEANSGPTEIPLDEETELADALKRLGEVHGVRPHSAGPPPTVSHVVPSNGPDAGGTAVTVTGTNFIGGSVVRFGNALATGIVVVSPTQITCVAPPRSAATATAAGAVGIAATGGTGTEDGTASATVDVRVVTAAGTSPTGSGAKFTYSPPAPPPPPVITFTEPDEVGNGGPLSTIVLKGQHLANPTKVTFKHPDPGVPLITGGLVSAPDNSDTRTTVSCPLIVQTPGFDEFLHVTGTLTTAGGDGTFEIIFYFDNGGVH